jgi:hypothetical protein
MGREVRRVPPNWQHPQDEKGYYRPMKDKTAQKAWENWMEEFMKWLTGEHDKTIAKYGENEYPKNEPYRAFCGWNGMPPDPAYYRPEWDESTATWFQVYETVTEGTPVTPPFATQAELVDYLVANGDFWDQRRRQEGRSGMDCGPWNRAAAEKFVGAGWAPSLMMTKNESGVTIKEPRDGI